MELLNSLNRREFLGLPAGWEASFANPDRVWSQPEEIISQFAGEPNLTADGHTLYFVHQYFSADLSKMIEADIYSVTIP